MWMQLLFFVIPIAYFVYYYKQRPEESTGNWKEDFKEFFAFDRITLSTVKKGMVLAFVLIMAFFILSAIFSPFLPEGYNSVSAFISDSFDLYGGLFILIIFIGVFVEEFFFRTFLIDRFGIFISTLFFALMHSSYGSWFELIGAFVLGLILAYWWRRDREFYVLVIGHFIYNLFIILIALG